MLKFLLSYFVNEIFGNNFETLVPYNSTLELRRRKLTEKVVPHGRFSQIYYFEEFSV